MKREELEKLVHYLREDKTGRVFALFGAGERGGQLIKLLKLLKIPLPAVIFDNNQKKQGGKLEGIIIEAPEKMLEYPNLEVLVTVAKGGEELKQQISQYVQQENIRLLPQSKLTRYLVACDFIQGEGLEIGAMHNPYPIDLKKALVRYVDLETKEKSRELFPELKEFDMVDVDIIDDGATLSTVAENSQDYIGERGLLFRRQLR